MIGHGSESLVAQAPRVSTLTNDTGRYNACDSGNSNGFISPPWLVADGRTKSHTQFHFFWKTSLATATADTALGQPE
jgi:hypothetical protein